ncbi:MAG: hypothetical protein ACRDHY_11385 [Anaerolineales bacterium]
MMDYAAFLERVINDGIEAAKRSYAKPRDQARLAGSIAGFEACRGKTPDQLRELLAAALRASQSNFHQRVHEGEITEEDYWHGECLALEVGWVCNVVSATLIPCGIPVIVPPTVRGVLKAAEIMGVRPAPG